MNSKTTFFETGLCFIPGLFLIIPSNTKETNISLSCGYSFKLSSSPTLVNKNANEKSHVGFCSLRDSRENLASGRWKIKIVGLCFTNYRFLKQ